MVRSNQVSIAEMSVIDEEVHEGNDEDLLIIFLDAASDSNAEVLAQTFDKARSEDGKKRLLTFQDGDCNTALHFGAENGNFKICQKIIDESQKLNLTNLLVNCRNSKGFSPLLLLAMRGYHLIGDYDEAVENRYRIIEKFLSAGAQPNYSKPETKMTALHWLAHNNDKRAVKVLLECQGIEWKCYNTYDNMAIDVAGTTPSWLSVDAFLDHYAKLNDLPEQRFSVE